MSSQNTLHVEKASQMTILQNCIKERFDLLILKALFPVDRQIKVSQIISQFLSKQMSQHSFLLFILFYSSNSSNLHTFLSNSPP